MKTVLGWRMYALMLLGAVLLLGVTRVFVMPEIDSSVTPTIGASIGQILDSLIGVTAGALIVSGLIYWLVPGNRSAVEDTVLVAPTSISNELRNSAITATTWTYRGHTGRYFRTTILPILAEAANKHGRYIDINLQILDPDDPSIIAFFSEYRASVNRDRADYWTPDKARAEVAATVIALAVAATNSSRLACNLYLTRLVSPFTIDLCDTQAIVTRESAKHDAIKYPAGSSFYDSVCEDLHLSARLARRVSISRSAIKVVGKRDDVTTVLDELNVVTKDRNKVVSHVLTALRNPVSPYGH
ncbi:hypothetical protein [Phytohabitans kaempferiae]|uniref:Uncharacterized protein n=1 Tax=Phytohabitans kaempferiae TaxID=1620943 RepID=A0ABV6MDD8_9ACTN